MTTQDDLAAVREALDFVAARTVRGTAKYAALRKAREGVDRLAARLEETERERDALASGLDLAIGDHWKLCGGCQYCNPARAALGEDTT